MTKYDQSGPDRQQRRGSPHDNASEPERVSRCRWCRVPIPQTAGAGRPRQFCTQACRQWDWVTRQRSRELHLSEHELVIARDALDELRDRIYVLACAIEDVADDVSPDVDPTTRDYRAALEWVLEAARGVVDHGAGHLSQSSFNDLRP